jgi:hypothetical protein
VYWGNGKILPEIFPMFSACTVHIGWPWLVTPLSLRWRILQNCCLKPHVIEPCTSLPPGRPNSFRRVPKCIVAEGNTPNIEATDPDAPGSIPGPTRFSEK